MYTDEQYFKKSSEQEGPYIDCDVFKHSGNLVELEDTFAIVDDEYNYVTRLPLFITSVKSAHNYISHLQYAYKDGEERGANKCKSDLAKFLGVVTVDTRNLDVDRIENRLERLEA